jgi:hypothetical protein
MWHTAVVNGPYNLPTGGYSRAGVHPVHVADEGRLVLLRAARSAQSWPNCRCVGSVACRTLAAPPSAHLCVLTTTEAPQRVAGSAQLIASMQIATAAGITTVVLSSNKMEDVPKIMAGERFGGEHHNIHHHARRGRKTYACHLPQPTGSAALSRQSPRLRRAARDSQNRALHAPFCVRPRATCAPSRGVQRANDNARKSMPSSRRFASQARSSCHRPRRSATASAGSRRCTSPGG